MPRPTPFEQVRGLLEARVGDAVQALPRRWERLGDVLVIRGVSDQFGDRAKHVAEAYARVLGVRLVLEDQRGVSGALREPSMRRLWGEGDAETSFVQDGVRYTLDAERLMFSSGNLEERRRMGRVGARGETVVDLFAGIGYFSLPLLVHGDARRVVACEVNPVALYYLEQNARDNGVADRLQVRRGDCRAVAPLGVADRVVSGWFPHGHTYLDVAFSALKDEGGTIHYHDTAHEQRARGELTGNVEAAARRAGRRVKGVDVRVVKSYAPGVVHAVADVVVGARAAVVAACTAGPDLPERETRNPAAATRRPEGAD